MMAKELKEWRRKWKLSQEALARLLKTHRITITQWETNRRKIPSFLHLALKGLEGELLNRNQNQRTEVAL
jgi:DNA-binding transcriptional regulator YiaG